MAQSRFTESDEGKRVLDKNRTKIGVVSGIRAGKVYVDLDPDVRDSVLAKHGWETIDADDYTLNQSDIDAVDGDEIRLKR